MIPRYTLRIGTRYVDLTERVVIATTFQLFNIGDLRSRSVSYTNSFEIEDTPTNRIIFGFAADVTSLSDIAYKKQVGELKGNGHPILKSCLVIVRDVNGGNLVLQLFDTTLDFFEQIEDLDIGDLDTLPYDIGVTLTPPVVRPFLDYGGNNPGDSPLPLIGQELYCVPYVFIIEQIINQNGYEKDGTIFTDAAMLRLHLAALGYGDYAPGWARPKEFAARRDTSLILNAGTTPLYVRLDIVEKESVYYNPANFMWKVVDTVYGGAFFLYKAHYSVKIDSISFGGGATYVNLLFFASGMTPKIIQITGPGVYSWEYSLDMGYASNCIGIHDAEQFMQMYTDSGTAAITFGDTRMWNTVITTKAGNLPITQSLPYRSVGAMFPDIKQTDFLADFANRFGVVFREVDGTLYCRTIEEILSNTADAVDWTKKRVKNIRDTMQYRFRNYAQRNRFTYDNEDNLPDVTGEGYLLVANENLTTKVNYFNAPFNQSDTILFGNDGEGYVSCARINSVETVFLENANRLEDCDLEAYGNLDLNGLTNVDIAYRSWDLTSKRVKRTVTVDADMRVLCRFQTDKKQNGTWLAKSGAWIRADSGTDLDKALITVAPRTQLTTGPATIYNGGAMGTGFTFIQINGPIVYSNDEVDFAYADNVSDAYGKSGSELKRDPGARLVMVRNKRSTEPTLAGGNSTYKVAYFKDGSESLNCDWQSMLDRFYPSLQRSLQRTKLVVREYDLTPTDISTLDPFKLIYDTDGYYLIQMASNYIPGQPTKVEILRKA